MPTSCMSTWPTAISRPPSCSSPTSSRGCGAETALPIHVHLMVADAVLLAQIDQFAEAGADLISIHAENANASPRALDRIAAHGLAAGMVLRVETPVAGGAPWLAPAGHADAAGHRHRREGAGAGPAAPDRLQEARAADRGAPGGASCWRPMAASATRRCRCCARQGPRRSSWARWPSARRTWRRGWPGLRSRGDPPEVTARRRRPLSCGRLLRRFSQGTGDLGNISQ